MADEAVRERDVDVVVVGAGFAGMYLLHRLRGLGMTTRVLEVADDVGGTWYWNRYPGARCDIQSLDYSFSFDPELDRTWEWSEKYATQPEILRYAQHVAERYDLRRDIDFGTGVRSGVWDDAARRWTVTTTTGEEIQGRFLVMATGCLSVPKEVDIPGTDRFGGPVYFTSRWPHEGVDFTGQRVGVIGTGSSGIQSVPLIAEEAAELYVFQRTAAYTVPAHNRAIAPEEEREIKAGYAAFREANRQMPMAFGSRLTPGTGESALSVADDDRLAEFEQRWADGGLWFLTSYNDLLLDPNANATAAEFVRAEIAEIVDDPELAAKLSPEQLIGCKRLCVDTGYYATFNRPNVHLVDLKATPIEAITPAGIRTTDGEIELDAIVYATGFDAMTGAILGIDIRGRDGLPLREAWEAGPRTYLGLGVHGFPNLFTITGPGSPSVLTNMIVSIEQHVEWITDCLARLRDDGVATIEAAEAAQEEWVDFVNSVGNITVFPTCNSWYLGANVPGKTRVFMPLPGFPMYAEICASVQADGYRGFTLA